MITHFATSTTSALSSCAGVTRLSRTEKSILLRCFSTEKKAFDQSTLDQSLVPAVTAPNLATTNSRIISSNISAGDEESFYSNERDNPLGEGEEQKVTCTNKVCQAVKVYDFIYII